MKAFDIVGYTYAVENWLPEELLEALIASGDLAPGARGIGLEAALDQLAGERGIDRQDERSFDSSEFPKVIFASQLNLEDDWDWYYSKLN